MHASFELQSPQTAATSIAGKVVFEGALGEVQIDFGSTRFAGLAVLDGAMIAPGDTLTLRLLCRTDGLFPTALARAIDVPARVVTVDDDAYGGCRQLVTPGLVLDVVVPALCDVMPHAAALKDEPPVVLGSSLDEALAGLVDVLEPEDDDDIDQISGSLRRMPLSELVQGLHLARKTATIRTRTPLGAGHVHLEDGDVVYAAFDGATGPTAFRGMLKSTRGTFRVLFGAHPPEQNVAVPTQALLLDALRMLDEEDHEHVAVASPFEDADVCALCDDDGPCAAHQPVRPAMTVRPIVRG